MHVGKAALGAVEVVADAGFYTGAHQSAIEAFDVMIATSSVGLYKRLATKLGTPDDKGLVERAALLEISQECGGWLVENFSVVAVSLCRALLRSPICRCEES